MQSHPPYLSKAMQKLPRTGQELLESRLLYVVPFQVMQHARIPFLQFLLVLQQHASKPAKYGLLTLRRQPSAADSGLDQHTLLLEETTHVLAKQLQMAPDDRARIEYRGYHIPASAPHTACLFLDLSKTGFAVDSQYRPEREQRIVTKWLLADEVINHRRHLDTPISTKAVHLFTRHIEWSLLYSHVPPQQLLESPSVVFALAESSRRNFARIFGHQVSNGAYGRKLYYFTDWEGAKDLRQKQEKPEDWCIVRYAFFSGNPRFIEDPSEPVPTALSAWDPGYGSLFVTREMGGITHYVARDRWRQLPLGIAL